jgi:hypothetical protein
MRDKAQDRGRHHLPISEDMGFAKSREKQTFKHSKEKTTSQ